MLDIANIEEIRRILLLLPELVDDHERRDPAFPSKVKDWLAQVERVLSGNRLVTAADVAALRSALIGAERGIVPVGLVIEGRSTRRKIRESVALDVLRKAEGLVSASIAADGARLSKAEQLGRELVAFAERKGILGGVLGASQVTQTQVKEMWKAVVDDKELGPFATRLAASVRLRDIPILLDQALTAFGLPL